MYKVRRRHWENGFPQTAKGLNYAALPRATTKYFPRQNPKINLGEWQENLRVISPGGVSPLRLIPGSLPLEDDTSPSSSRTTERREEGMGGESARIQYEATPQRTKHPSVLIFSISYAEDRQRAAGIEDIRSRVGSRWTTTSDPRSLMTKFSIRQTSTRGNGSRVSRACETDVKAAGFNREEKEEEWQRVH